MSTLLPPAGSPNGRVSASADAIYIDTESGDLYRNVDGATGWVKTTVPVTQSCARVPVWDGSPDGAVYAEAGSIVIDGTNGAVYRNTTGAAVWVEMVSGAYGGSTGFLSGTFITPAQLTVSTDDYAPTGYEDCAGMILDANSGAVALSGIAGGVEGRMMWLIWKNPGGTSSFSLTNEDAASVAANRFACPNSADINLSTAFLLIYIGSRWHISGSAL